MLLFLFNLRKKSPEDLPSAERFPHAAGSTGGVSPMLGAGIKL